MEDQLFTSVIKKNYLQHDFGFGNESTSHVESIWSQLKIEIKSTYKCIYHLIIFLYYLKESEWKIKYKNLNFSAKLDDFMEMYYRKRHCNPPSI